MGAADGAEGELGAYRFLGAGDGVVAHDAGVLRAIEAVRTGIYQHMDVGRAAYLGEATARAQPFVQADKVHGIACPVQCRNRLEDGRVARLVEIARLEHAKER
ncbi:MAG TPA: hypothetical protein VJR71_15065, partial [Pseudolabrys sp.]|nr:hypothetical protein [Pseudolabrys sp.]